MPGGCRRQASKSAQQECSELQIADCAEKPKKNDPPSAGTPNRDIKDDCHDS